MTMKEYSTLPRFPELKQFSVIYKTPLFFEWGVYTLSRGIQLVYSKPCQQGNEEKEDLDQQ